MPISISYAPVGAIGTMAFEGGRGQAAKWWAEYNQRERESAAARAAQERSQQFGLLAQGQLAAQQAAIRARELDAQQRFMGAQTVFEADRALQRQREAAAESERSQRLGIVAGERTRRFEADVARDTLGTQQAFSGQMAAYNVAQEAAQQERTREAARQSQLLGIGASREAAGFSAEVGRERLAEEQAFSREQQQAAFQQAKEMQRATAEYQQSRDEYEAAVAKERQVEATAAAARSQGYAQAHSMTLAQLHIEAEERRAEMEEKRRRLAAFEAFRYSSAGVVYGGNLQRSLQTQRLRAAAEQRALDANIQQDASRATLEMLRLANPDFGKPDLPSPLPAQPGQQSDAEFW